MTPGSPEAASVSARRHDLLAWLAEYGIELQQDRSEFDPNPQGLDMRRGQVMASCR